MPKLMDQQKLERRGRILTEVRQCFVKRGYDSVTMKELAEAAGVSVPTLYNRFGGKDELLFAAVEEQFEQLLGGLGTDWSGAGASAVFKVLESCNNMLLGAPGYTRTLLSLLTTTGELQIRSSMMSVLAEQLSSALERAKSSGDLVDWVEPQVLAERIRDSYIMLAFAWGMGERDDDGLRQGAEFLVCVTLLGVAGNDDLRAELEKRAQVAQAILQSNQPVAAAGA
jgi:AcrR family transcriptional regulator